MNNDKEKLIQYLRNYSITTLGVFCEQIANACGDEIPDMEEPLTEVEKERVIQAVANLIFNPVEIGLIK